MKKILMVTHTPLPDHRIDREARSLVEKGYELYIICSGIKRKAPEVYTKIFEIPLSNKEKSLLPFQSKIAAKKFQKVIDDVNPEIIHAHDIMAANIVRYCNLSGKKFVYDTHEDWELLRKRQRKIEPSFIKRLAVIFYTYPATRRTTKRIAKIADLIILTTKFSIDYYVKMGINIEKIITIENFPKQKLIKTAIKSEDLVDSFIKNDPRKKVVHSSSRIKASSKIVRDISVYVEAVNELDDWVMIVFGPEDEIYSKLGVKFLPPRDQLAYMACISQCDVALNPLILDERTHYSSSNRIFEFVSLGLKVLSSKAKYLVEKFDDNLIWAGPDIPKETVKQILMNIDNYPTKKELQKIGSKFSWDEEIEKLFQKYVELFLK